jgi:hypothetical protein
LALDGHASASTTVDPKCDILSIPDVVLGMGEAMRRRELIAFVGSTAVAWPLMARAQGSVAIVAFAVSGSRANQDPIAAFEAGLKDMGFVQGQNLTLEYRFAEGKFDRFPALISDLVQRKVAVLVVSSPQGALAAKRATTEIPIVFSIGTDPVEVGLVPSLNKPGSNLTGVYQFTAGLKCPAWTCRPSTAASVPGKASARPELDNSQDPKRTRTVQDFLQRKFILKPISPVANPCCSPTLKPA